MIKKIYISYFYQIRYMKPNMLPVSTAAWDPKWYHNPYFFYDRNGVYNGSRIDILVCPKNVFESLPENARCDTNCPVLNKDDKNRDMCPFEKAYYQYLSFLKFKTVLKALERKTILVPGIDTIVLLVHEPPYKRCAERVVLQKWFADNGYTLEEWNPNEI